MVFAYMHVLLDEMDNGKVFSVKIPVNDLLPAKRVNVRGP